MDDKGEVLMTF